MTKSPPDIDTLRRAFDALAGNAQIAQMLVQVTRDGTPILAANPAACTLLANEDLVGTNLMDLLVESELRPDAGALADVFAGTLDMVGRRRRYMRADGGTATVDVLAFTINASAKAVVMLVVLAEPSRTEWMLRRLQLDIEVKSALSELRASLLAGEGGDALMRRISDATATLINATNVGFMRLEEPDHVRLASALYPAINPTGTRWAIIDDDFGRALREARVAGFSIADPAGATSGTRIEVAMAPLSSGTQLLGSLMARRDTHPFTDQELELLGTYADGASEALTLADARTEALRLRVREEIARDLHDDVIQDLIAVRLGLTSLARQTTDATAALKARELLDEVDRSTKQLRDLVRGLDDVATTAGFRSAVLSLTTRRAERAGIAWNIWIDDAVAAGMTTEERREVLSVVNEAVSNVVRHADGTRVDITLEAASGRAMLTVRDDGAGLGEASHSRGSGLKNVAARAAHLGGDCTVQHQERGGTKLTWWIPLRSPA